MNEFKINGGIMLPEDSKLTEEEILDKFIDFVESVDGAFLGITGLEEMIK